MNYDNNKRKLSSTNESASSISSNKWQRLDESSMIGNNENIPARAGSTTDALHSSSSSSSGGDEPVGNNNLSCGEAAAQSSTSVSIIDNIFPSSSVLPSKSLIQPQQTQHAAAQSNNNGAPADQPMETTSAKVPLTSPSSTTMAAEAAALRCNKKSMIQSPVDFFTAQLRSRGYPATTFCSLKSGYHSTPTVSSHLLYFGDCSLSNISISLTRFVALLLRSFFFRNTKHQATVYHSPVPSDRPTNPKYKPSSPPVSIPTHVINSVNPSFTPYAVVVITPCYVSFLTLVPLSKSRTTSAEPHYMMHVGLHLQTLKRYLYCWRRIRGCYPLRIVEVPLH